MTEASNYNYESVDNGQNNFLAGGNMAFKDNTLYVSAVSDVSQKSKTLAINNKGVKLLNTTNDSKGYIFGIPTFYQTKDKLYVDGYELNTNDNSLKKADKKTINNLYNLDYLSDDLVVESLTYGSKLKITYHEKTYTLKQDYRNLCVGNNKVYCIDSDEELYCFDPEKRKRFEYFADTMRDSDLLFWACGGCVYYNAIGEPNSQYGDDRADSGLYCYCEKNKSHKLIIQGGIKSLNSYDDTLYVAADSGVYKCKKDKVKKLCGEKADEIYILDKTWIYGLNRSNATVFRVAQNGSKTERVPLNIK